MGEVELEKATEIDKDVSVSAPAETSKDAPPETPQHAPKDPERSDGGEATAEAASNGTNGTNGKSEATPILIEGAEATEAKEAKEAKATGPVELEDSDDEMEVSGAMAEMLLPQNLLSEEFADEAVSIDGDDSLKDKPPFPPFPPRNFEPPSDARKRVLAKVKAKASELLAEGLAEKALEKYSELIKTGGATALIMAARAEVLLKLGRPCAAIRDCCAALQMNADCGKAYHVRGAAHHQLQHWKKAYRDLSQGQRLDFQEGYAAMHALVTKKAGVDKEKTSPRHDRHDRAKIAEKVLHVESPVEEVKLKPPSKEFKIGQAVRLGGLLKAPHLNGKRGLVQRLSTQDNDRWEVEIRLDRGVLEVKSIRSENIIAVPRNQAAEWQLEEARFTQERQKREKEDKRWNEEQEKSKKFNTFRNVCEKTLNAQGFPIMDSSEKLEAEMSCLPLDHEALALLRRLRPQEALQVLQQVSIQGINNNMSSYIKIKVRSKLGDPDNTDEDPKMPQPVPAKTEPRPSAATPAPATPEPTPEPVKRPAEEALEEANEDDSEDEDFDLLPEEKEPTLGSGFIEEEPTEKQLEAFGRWKQEAQDSLEAGDVKTSLERLTEVIEGGGGSALMLTKRGELLLKERRPLAAIQDCSAALQLNPDLGKAYRVRGIAHRKLGKYKVAKSDLAQAQNLDFDEGVSFIEKFVSEKVRLEERRRKRQKTQ